jgi:cell fate regulator YaaT (PSP1 superfamily)
MFPSYGGLQQQPQPQPHHQQFQPSRGGQFNPPPQGAMPPSFVGAIGSRPRHDINPTELGKGVPLNMISPQTPLYIVEFKAGRTDLYYSDQPDLHIGRGDLVIVEADRGQDLGRVVNDTISLEEVKAFQVQRRMELAQLTGGKKFVRASGPLAGLEVGMGLSSSESNADGPSPAVLRAMTKEIMPKRIFGKAGPADQQLLVAKLHDEAQALALCQATAKQHKLPMEIVDVEYQWDRARLTIFFQADRRVDHRNYVRELFRRFKCRLWLSQL